MSQIKQPPPSPLEFVNTVLQFILLGPNDFVVSLLMYFLEKISPTGQLMIIITDIFIAIILFSFTCISTHAYGDVYIYKQIFVYTLTYIYEEDNDQDRNRAKSLCDERIDTYCWNISTILVDVWDHYTRTEQNPRNIMWNNDMFALYRELKQW